MFAPEHKLTAKDLREAERQVAILQGGDPTELGKAYLRLASIYKWIGTGSGARLPFPASANMADLAVDLLRNSPDRLAYARALRASVVAFTTDRMPEARARLEEALAITRELGDKSEIGWTLSAIARHARGSGDRKEADKFEKLKHDVWMESGDDECIADALFTDALMNDRGWEQYERAAGHYISAKGWHSAATSFNMAAINADHVNESRETVRRLVRQQVICEQRWGDKAGVRRARKLLRRFR